MSIVDGRVTDSNGVVVTIGGMDSAAQRTTWYQFQLAVTANERLDWQRTSMMLQRIDQQTVNSAIEKVNRSWVDITDSEALEATHAMMLSGIPLSALGSFDRGRIFVGATESFITLPPFTTGPAARAYDTTSLSDFTGIASPSDLPATAVTGDLFRVTSAGTTSFYQRNALGELVEVPPPLSGNYFPFRSFAGTTVASFTTVASVSAVPASAKPGDLYKTGGTDPSYYMVNGRGTPVAIPSSVVAEGNDALRGFVSENIVAGWVEALKDINNHLGETLKLQGVFLQELMSSHQTAIEGLSNALKRDRDTRHLIADRVP